MAKAILTVLLIVLLNVLVGCRSADSGESQIMPSSIKAAAGKVSAAQVIGAREADIIEQIAINRNAYRQGLEALIGHYKNTGNNMQLVWAENELKQLNDMPQYNYIVEASVAGPSLRAVSTITEADYMYDDALRTEKKARGLIVIVDEDLLRVALDKYNHLIRKHPASDKIDDAAFRAGGICEHFKDYTIALLYYQRACQWDPDTPHLARYKAARILDRHMSRRAEALELYKQSLEKEALNQNQKELVETRITELIKGEESLEDSK